MRYFLLLTFFLSYQILADGLTEKEFARVIALKGDNKKLPDVFSIYTISSESKSYFRYEYSADKIQEVRTVNKVRTVEGKYLVIEAYAKQYDVTAFSVLYWDKATERFIACSKFPNQPIIHSKGKIEDKSTIFWETKRKNGGHCEGTEKVNGKVSTTTEKYYDKNNNFTHSGSLTTTYK